MQPAEQIWSAEGAFSFETLVCQLLRSDIGEGSDIRSSAQQIADEVLLITLSFGVANQIDSVTLTELPTGISADTSARLFHERVHYWQFLASPVQQMRFLIFLEGLRCQLADLGGRIEMICGNTPYHTTADKSEVEAANTRVETDFRWIEIEPQMVLGFDEIDYEKPTFQLYFHLPNALDWLIPAYGAWLHFGPDHQQVYVPFTALPLLESAAYVAQQMFEGKSLPAIDHMDDKWMRRYYGCWEYWRRLHGKRYRNEEELGLSFLAAVDLAMAGDFFYEEIVGPEYYSTELKAENESVAYRFGKLAFRAQGIDPLTCDNVSPAVAVTKFQEECCEQFGWTPPHVVMKKMIVSLTRALVAGCWWTVNWAEGSDRVMKRLFESPLHVLAEDLEDLRPLWRSLANSDFQNENHVLGKRIIGMMINACWDRLEHPGELAVPYKYAEALAGRFPLPFVLFDGAYHYDQRLETAETVFMSDRPYPLNSQAVAGECTQLLPLAPLRTGHVDCGMIDSVTHEPKCFFTRVGLGCPWLNRHLARYKLKGEELTKDQRALRDRYNLDDWCHWTFAALKMQIAPKEVAERWTQRAS